MEDLEVCGGWVLGTNVSPVQVGPQAGSTQKEDRMTVRLVQIRSEALRF